MMKARIVVGSNWGDEGKGTVVAKYSKDNGKTLNILTNGGAQRGHSILTENGSITYQHFGSGTCHNADTYYSPFFILNPMQFAKEYAELIVKPKLVTRHPDCRWSTLYDMMANAISEQLQKRHASCGMGIWNTIKRYKETSPRSFDSFIAIPLEMKLEYLDNVKTYYENKLTIPDNWKNVWNSPAMKIHFIGDCNFMHAHTVPVKETALSGMYDNLIFENGQGLLLCDTGKDTYDTTPSNTGIEYAMQILREMNSVDGNGNPLNIGLSLHYVTRPYLTRHGDGEMQSQTGRSVLSQSVMEDRTNKFNDFQGEFRYGKLDIESLKRRIENDARGLDYEVELTHCDEMDRVGEFKKMFNKVNITDNPLV